MADAAPLIREIPADVQARIRALADNPEYRTRIAEALAAVERGDTGRVYKKARP